MQHTSKIEVNYFSCKNKLTLYHSRQDSQDQAPLPIGQWGNTFTELFSPADLEKNAYWKGLSINSSLTLFLKPHPEMETNRIGWYGRSQEQVQIAPETESYSRLQSGSKQYLSFFIIRSTDGFSGFGIVHISSIHLIHVSGADGKIRVDRHDVFLSQMEIPSHI